MMPQTNVIPDWKLTYANDAKAQKVPGISISIVLSATAVPNKPTNPVYIVDTAGDFIVDTNGNSILRVS